MKLLSLHLIVSGRVQGVGFRFFTQEKARILGITGYVKNLANGDVEIYAEGEELNIAKFFQQAKKGPSFSRVIDTQTEWNKITEKKYNNFSITY